MLEIASEITICLLLAALIGFAIGYLLGKSQSQKSESTTPSEIEGNTKKESQEPEEDSTIEEADTEVSPMIEDTPPSEDIEIPTENAIEKALDAVEDMEEQETETTKTNEEVGQKPELLSEPRAGGKDNLAKIKGIGPKVEEKLNASGIYHFEQIANWTEANMIWLEAHTLFASRAKKESWITEAKSFL